MEWLKKISPSINLIGHAPWQKGFIEPERVIYDHELVLFTAGECILTISGMQYICNAPCWLIVPPGQKHRSEASGDNGVYRHWIHFDWLYVKSEMPSPVCTYSPEVPDKGKLRIAPAFVPRKVLHGRINDLQKTVHTLEKLKNLWHSEDMLETMTARAVLLELLIRLTGYAKPGRLPRQSSRYEEALAMMLKTHLEKMPSQAVDIRSYIEKLGYSYGHLCRIFKKHYGLPPLPYLNLLRLQIAAAKLRHPGTGVANAADAAGFNDPAYFSRIFKRHFGLSPREWQSKKL